MMLLLITNQKASRNLFRGEADLTLSGQCHFNVSTVHVHLVIVVGKVNTVAASVSDAANRVGVF